jgi:endonuclease YncB( thermonuclease family)
VTAIAPALQRRIDTRRSRIEADRVAAFGPYRGVVDLVHDGDTVNVKLDVGFDLTVYARVRINGINAPELATAAGKAAREYGRTLLPAGTAVEVVSLGWDKYGGRIDGQITFGGKDFAQAMIDAGHAKTWDGHGTRPT